MKTLFNNDRVLSEIENGFGYMDDDYIDIAEWRMKQAENGKSYPYVFRALVDLKPALQSIAIGFLHVNDESYNGNQRSFKSKNKRYSIDINKQISFPFSRSYFCDKLFIKPLYFFDRNSSHYADNFIYDDMTNEQKKYNELN